MNAHKGNNESRLEVAVATKLHQWNREAAISAAGAIQAGRTAVEVVYPTGLKMMRFAEPFGECGMHYEVPPQVWSALVASGGKIRC